MKFLLVLTIGLLPLLAQAQKIIQLQTKTGDGNWNEMLPGGSLNVELLMTDNTYCRMSELYADGSNFQLGKIDVFDGDDLGDCANFTAPGGEIAKMGLTHRKELHLNCYFPFPFNSRELFIPLQNCCQLVVAWSD